MEEYDKERLEACDRAFESMAGADQAGYEEIYSDPEVKISIKKREENKEKKFMLELQHGKKKARIGLRTLIEILHTIGLPEEFTDKTYGF